MRASIILRQDQRFGGVIRLAVLGSTVADGSDELLSLNLSSDSSPKSTTPDDHLPKQRVSFPKGSYSVNYSDHFSELSA